MSWVVYTDEEGTLRDRLFNNPDEYDLFLEQLDEDMIIATEDDPTIRNVHPDDVETIQLFIRSQSRYRTRWKQAPTTTTTTEAPHDAQVD